MKFSTFLLICFFYFQAHANSNTSNLDQFFHSTQANQLCQNAVIVNGNIIKNKLKFIQADEKEAFFVFKERNTMKVVIVDLVTKKERSLYFEDKLVSIHLNENEVIFLSQRKMTLLSRHTDQMILQVDTLPRHLAYGKNANASALNIDENYIYIAHGLNGVIIFDKNNYQFVKQIKPVVTQPEAFHRSSITGLAVKGDDLYMAFDDVTLVRNSKAFEGIVVYDLEEDRKTKEVPVNQLQEGYYKPRLIINQDELIVSNLNLFYRHKLKKLGKRRYLKPFQRMWKYPAGGLIGQALVKNQSIYGCFLEESTMNKSAGAVKLK